jgi:hypothetical protein
MGRSALVVVAVVLIALFAFTRHSPAATTHAQDPPAFGGSGSVNAHLSVVPTIRSVTVSPGSVSFGNCTGGQGDTASVKNQMGYPNGTCSVITSSANANLPVTITYTGLAGRVYVSGSSAVPSDNGTNWSLCNPGGQPTCTGGQGEPGEDQYTVETSADEVASAAALTGNLVCDSEFDTGGGCAATPAEFKSQSQNEGIKLIGPRTWDDHSTSWSVTVTWTAASSS